MAVAEPQPDHPTVSERMDLLVDLSIEERPFVEEWKRTDTELKLKTGRLANLRGGMFEHAYGLGFHVSEVNMFNGIVTFAYTEKQK